MEVAPFFVDFHHFLLIFTIFHRFSRFTHFCRDLHFGAIYALCPQFFLAKIAFSATSHVFCMYGTSNQSEPIKGILRPQSRSSRHLRTKTSKARAHASCTFLSRAILTFPRGRGGGYHLPYVSVPHKWLW